MSYLINSNGELEAYTSKRLKSGQVVLVSYDRCKNGIDANKEYDLVNAFECKVSNAKKWDKFCESYYAGSCLEINENEFYI